MKIISMLLTQLYANVVKRNVIEFQDHSAQFRVKESAHNMCDMNQIDLNKYECEDTDDITKCKASCQLNTPYAKATGIMKNICQCYTSYGPVMIYE